MKRESQRRTTLHIACLLALLSAAVPSVAQSGESAGTAAWPNPLILQDGTPVTTASVFEQQRRPEILGLLAKNIYGETPRGSLKIVVVSSKQEVALDGIAHRMQTTLAVGPHGELTWHLLLYTPIQATHPVPIVIGLNFDGNQTVDSDPGIDLNPVWIRDPALASTPLAKELSRHVKETASLQTRGSAASQWQLKLLLSRGYGLATLYAGEVEPDFLGGIGYGVRPLFFGAGQRTPAASDWGALGAWAWAMSRIADVLAANSAVDSKDLIAFGFSRFGKAALWASAQDQRFAVTLSNESGQGGATLSHREQGEPISHLMLAFPYWFCANYQHYLGAPQSLPLDGHLLLSLIAPRALYVGSAAADPFSDAEGEFLSASAVGPVYALYGQHGLGASSMPPLNRSVGDRVAYHVRSGGHDVTQFDWQQYLDFADRQLSHSAR